MRDNPFTTHDSKNYLINQLRNGNEGAYELLFNEYYPKLTIFAKKYVDELEVAKEIVQDFFVHLYEKHDSLSINTSLKSYLFRSVHNRCINYIQAQKTRTKYAEFVIKSQAEHESSIEQEVDKSELEHALFKAIGDLPARCQEIFKLNRFEGKTNDEIAELLSLSKRTVETQISKALKILRIKLDPFMAAGAIVIFTLLKHWQ